MGLPKFIPIGAVIRYSDGAERKLSLDEAVKYLEIEPQNRVYKIETIEKFRSWNGDIYTEIVITFPA